MPSDTTVSTDLFAIFKNFDNIDLANSIYCEKVQVMSTLLLLQANCYRKSVVKIIVANFLLHCVPIAWRLKSNIKSSVL